MCYPITIYRDLHNWKVVVNRNFNVCNVQNSVSLFFCYIAFHYSVYVRERSNNDIGKQNKNRETLLKNSIGTVLT